MRFPQGGFDTSKKPNRCHAHPFLRGTMLQHLDLQWGFVGKPQGQVRSVFTSPIPIIRDAHPAFYPTANDICGQIH